MGSVPIGYAEWAPPRSLGWAIECLWSRRSDDVGGENTILPDGCADLIFDLSPRGGSLVGGGVSGRRAIAVGTMTEPIRAGVSAGALLVGVRFRPGFAFPFLGAPLDELVDRRVDVEELWTRSAVDRTLERLSSADSPVEWARALQSELAPRGACVPDRAVARAVRWILDSQGRVRAGTLAERLGVSRQTLARRFRRQVGVGPKMLARVIRVRSTIERLDDSEAVDWADLALIHGFSDQAHLCAEFRRLAGQAPTRFHAARQAR